MTNVIYHAIFLAKEVNVAMVIMLRCDCEIHYISDDG